MDFKLNVLIDISDRLERTLNGLRQGLSVPRIAELRGEDLMPKEPELKTELKTEPKTELKTEPEPEKQPEPEKPEDKKLGDKKLGDEGFDISTAEGLKGYMASFKTWLLGEGWEQNRTPEIDYKARKINSYYREIARELGAERPTELAMNKREEFCRLMNQIEIQENGEVVRMPF